MAAGANPSAELRIRTGAMSRSGLLAPLLAGVTFSPALAQAVNPTPGTEAAQSNALLGTPVWLILGVIVAFAVLYAFRTRRRR
jgi:hypothetical protein